MKPINEATNALAESMGVEAFRPGRQILRNEKRWRIGEITVVHAWHAFIQPSFHDWAVLAVVRTRDTEFRGQTFTGFFRSGIAVVPQNAPTVRSCAVADIQEDPLPDALSALDLMANTDNIVLDGIGYELHIQTAACRSTLRFFNPRIPWIRKIEDSLIQIGSHIARDSKDYTAVQFLETWRRYIADSGRSA